MDKNFSYDFLKVEFREIYDDIDKLIKRETDSIDKNINYLVDDIIFHICKKEGILYEEEDSVSQKLNMIKEKELMPIQILEKLILWINKVQINYLTSISNEYEYIEAKMLYEILVWFVVNYGEEDYFMSEVLQ